jgi:hypothetical protein
MHGPGWKPVELPVFDYPASTNTFIGGFDFQD